MITTKHIWLAIFAALTILCSTSSYSATIIDNLLPTSTSSYGSAWFGAMELNADNASTGPDGYDRYSVAQSFKMYSDYSQVTAAVSLSAVGPSATEPLPVATFSITTDDNNAPGSTVATIDISLTTASLNIYNLLFENLSLYDGQTYWLVANSPSIMTTYLSPNCCTGTLPAWAGNSAASGGATSQNSEPWQVYPYQGYSFALYGTETGNPIDNGYSDNGIYSPIPPVPEPQTYAMLLAGLGLIGFTVRRRKQAYIA